MKPGIFAVNHDITNLVWIDSSGMVVNGGWYPKMIDENTAEYGCATAYRVMDPPAGHDYNQVLDEALRILQAEP